MGETSETGTPLVDTLRELMAGFHAPFVPGLPRFTGGAVGYLAYDAAAWFEPVRLQPTSDSDDEAGFMLFDTVLAFDHVRHRILIIANARITGDEDLESLYQFACTKIEFVERELDRTLSKAPPAEAKAFEVTSNVTREQFEQIVRTAKEYIAAGDIYQVVLSQRFESAITVDPFTVYRALRHVNPSPYMYFLRIGGRSIVGSSPEMLVRVEGRRVETHPIAGTRPRGRNEEEDLRLAEELKRNEKERAEHVMLVDLGRNDVGRVAEYGSVRVPTYMALERYSHVMHLVSIVEGRLRDEFDRLDALVACFPAGTVSGAPKVRAMEIIAELEPDRRGVYSGAVGYFAYSPAASTQSQPLPQPNPRQMGEGQKGRHYNGNMDTAIAIRTIVLKDGVAHMQAGGGVVMDSTPEGEYQESLQKMRALLRAIDHAEEDMG
jgi:anthranilate synthase component 1